MPIRSNRSSSCYNLAVQTGYDFKFRSSSPTSDEDNRSWTSDDSHSTTASSPPLTGFRRQVDRSSSSVCPSLYKGARSLQIRSWNEKQAYIRRSQHGGCDHQISTQEGCTPRSTQTPRSALPPTQVNHSNIAAPSRPNESANGCPLVRVERNTSPPTPEPNISYPSVKIEQLTALSAPAQPVKTNPRRTQSSTQSSVCQTQSRCPPQLTRQSNRQQNFVENLVGKHKSFRDDTPCTYFIQDTAAQMIEAIWPLSATEVAKDDVCGKNLIDLRTFIQEVLKRSKTSFYTLQVALYYLVLIKTHIPATQANQSERSHAEKAMHCGRRMFLAALILASKYLQDRNYSARAWSKISGLKITEINTNEIAFLTAVGWKLHIPEKHFQRWSNIVFRYSVSVSATASIEALSKTRLNWKGIVQRLTPELNENDLAEFGPSPVSQPCQMLTSAVNIRGGSLDPLKTPIPAAIQMSPWTASTSETYPDSDAYSLPTFTTPVHPFRTLPTPVDTPTMNGSCTPAARPWFRGETMRGVMQQAQRDVLKSCSLDGGLAVRRPGCSSIVTSQARGRIVPVASLVSSPASMVSDTTLDSVSSGASRSSSVSSTRSFPYANSTCISGGVKHQTNFPSRFDGTLHQCHSVSTPYVVSGDNQSYETEMDAILALASLSRSEMNKTGAPVNRIIPRPRQGQKRERPLSVTDQDICEETRRQLAQAYDGNGSVVAPSNYEAKTFVLSQPEIVNQLLLPRLKQSGPLGRPESKRSRIGQQSSGTTLANEIQPTLVQTSSSWPYGSDRTVPIR